MPIYAVGLRRTDEALRKILSVNLQARLVLCEIRRASANFELDSPLINLKKQAELIKMRDAALVEWGVVMTELEDLLQPSGGDPVHSPSSLD